MGQRRKNKGNQKVDHMSKNIRYIKICEMQLKQCLARRPKINNLNFCFKKLKKAN